MHVIKYKNTFQQRKLIIRLLKKGGVIIYSTETAYGLGCDAKNKKAIDNIYKIKKRSKKKKLLLLCSSINQVKKFFSLNKKEQEFAKEKWPGPFCLVLKQKRKNVLGLNYDPGVRVSSLKLARQLPRLLGRPIISTSANISGNKALYSIKEIIKEFENKKQKPDLIIDAGTLPKRGLSKVGQVVNDKVVYFR